MKKLTFRLLAIVLVAVSSLASCLEDEPYGADRLMYAIGNLHLDGGRSFHFRLDEGSTLYPGDTASISGYQLVDGQRAFIYFTLLPEPMPGYDYNGSIRHIENILTKDIFRLTAAAADTIGNDLIDVDDLWLTDDYLNILYRFYHSNNPQKKHLLNLMLPSETPQSDGYLLLEFRHNAYSDTPLQGGTGIVSFRLDSVQNLLPQVAGIRLRVNTLYGGIRDFDLPLRQP